MICVSEKSDCSGKHEFSGSLNRSAPLCRLLPGNIHDALKATFPIPCVEIPGNCSHDSALCGIAISTTPTVTMMVHNLIVLSGTTGCADDTMNPHSPSKSFILKSKSMQLSRLSLRSTATNCTTADPQMYRAITSPSLPIHPARRPCLSLPETLTPLPSPPFFASSPHSAPSPRRSLLLPEVELLSPQAVLFEPSNSFVQDFGMFEATKFSPFASPRGESSLGVFRWPSLGPSDSKLGLCESPIGTPRGNHGSMAVSIDVLKFCSPNSHIALDLAV